VLDVQRGQAQRMTLRQRVQEVQQDSGIQAAAEGDGYVRVEQAEAAQQRLGAGLEAGNGLQRSATSLKRP
jgi:hypothetical protein